MSSHAAEVDEGQVIIERIDAMAMSIAGMNYLYYRANMLDIRVCYSVVRKKSGFL